MRGLQGTSRTVTDAGTSSKTNTTFNLSNRQRTIQIHTLAQHKNVLNHTPRQNGAHCLTRPRYDKASVRQSEWLSGHHGAVRHYLIGNSVRGKSHCPSRARRPIGDTTMSGYVWCVGSAVSGSAAATLGKFALDNDYTVPIAAAVQAAILPSEVYTQVHRGDPCFVCL